MDWLREDLRRDSARSIVNRVWAGYFNVGIIQPTDDLNRPIRRATAPLLDYLTDAFVEHGYDLKWLHREILNSRTYQLSWQPNDTNRLDQRNFSHAMSAPVAGRSRLRCARAGDRRQGRTGSQPAEPTDYRAIGLGSARRSENRGNKAAESLTRWPCSASRRRLTNCDCERSSPASFCKRSSCENDQETFGHARPRPRLAGRGRRKIRPGDLRRRTNRPKASERSEAAACAVVEPN